METARQVGLPLSEQLYFADFFYPLCGDQSGSFRIYWWQHSDPSPLDGDLTMHDAEWKELDGKVFTIALTKLHRTELARRRDYFILRGGKLFSLESPFIAHTMTDEMAYRSPCTPQQLLKSNFKTAIECRADALHKLIDEIGARADLYPSESKKLYMVLGGAYAMGNRGVVVGACVGTALGEVFAPVGGAVGSKYRCN